MTSGLETEWDYSGRKMFPHQLPNVSTLSKLPGQQIPRHSSGNWENAIIPISCCLLINKCGYQLSTKNNQDGLPQRSGNCRLPTGRRFGHVTPEPRHGAGVHLTRSINYVKVLTVLVQVDLQHTDTPGEIKVLTVLVQVDLQHTDTPGEVKVLTVLVQVDLQHRQTWWGQSTYCTRTGRSTAQTHLVRSKSSLYSYR